MGNKAMIMREGWRGGRADGREKVDPEPLKWRRCLSINKREGRHTDLITQKKREEERKWRVRAGAWMPS